MAARHSCIRQGWADRRQGFETGREVQAGTDLAVDFILDFEKGLEGFEACLRFETGSGTFW